MIILVGGGSRSGKSRYALDTARSRGSRLAFIATAQARDEEMAERVRLHRADRGPGFTTFEEPLEVASLLLRETAPKVNYDAIVVDCLTLWVSNLMFAERDLAAESRALLEAAESNRAAVILVTNEVGCGIVPENALARRFRDEAGRLNQLAAARAAEVYWMVFGVPLKVKG